MNLLLAAFPPELGSWLNHPPRGWLSACVGVGALKAALGTVERIHALHPKRILFLGTCGRYDQRLSQFELLSVSKVRASSSEEIQGYAYRPELETTLWTCQIHPPFPRHTVVCPPAITRCESCARRLASLGAAEHLELSGVLAAAHMHQIPAGAALVVVNEVGPMAQAQWRSHHQEGSQRLRDALQEWLEEGLE